MESRKISALSLTFLALALSALSFSASAAGPDFSTLTSAVDFSTVITAILAVFAALAGVFVVTRGGQLILEKIRR